MKWFSIFGGCAWILSSCTDSSTSLERDVEENVSDAAGSDDADHDLDGGSVDSGSEQSPVNIGPAMICTREAWPSPGVSKETQECLQVDVVPTGLIWNCQCGGETMDGVESGPDQEDVEELCQEVLNDACGTPSRTFCEDGIGRGTCWSVPDASNNFECRCGEEQETELITNSDGCLHALSAHCATSCEEEGIGACAPSSAGPLLYDCTCDSFNDHGRTTKTLLCEDALEQVCQAQPGECNVGSNDIGCNSDRDVCAMTGDGYACWCADDTSHVVSNENICEAAIETACGVNRTRCVTRQ